MNFESFINNLGAILNALKPRITVAFAAASWIMLYIHAQGLVFLPANAVVSAWIVAIFSTCLALCSLLAHLWGLTEGPRQHLVEMFHQHREKKRIQVKLDYLTPAERGIIAYLLANQQRVFEVLPDGEEAATLIAKGFVAWTARKPPALHRDITVEVPAHVWDVLVKNRARFPYEAPTPKVQPWRTPWMAR